MKQHKLLIVWKITVEIFTDKTFFFGNVSMRYFSPPINIQILVLSVYEYIKQRALSRSSNWSPYLKHLLSSLLLNCPAVWQMNDFSEYKNTINCYYEP